MESHMNSLFTVYNQRLAGYLMMNGFPLVRMSYNRRTDKNNFVFPNTDMLHEYIDRWQMERFTNKLE